jgi:hypothetical protein
MSRVLVLIGAFVFFRAVLPRPARCSPAAITPYMNALDGMMSAERESSVLDEVMPYESWLASRRTNASPGANGEPLAPPSAGDGKYVIPASQGGAAEVVRR